jgi:hypothetical protein
MAKLFFGLNQSLDGYIDHQEFAPGPALFHHFIEQVRRMTGSVYGRRGGMQNAAHQQRQQKGGELPQLITHTFVPDAALETWPPPRRHALQKPAIRTRPPTCDLRSAPLNAEPYPPIQVGTSIPREKFKQICTYAPKERRCGTC